MNNKLALLIGINYIGTPYELKGCINDVVNVKNMLVNNLRYKEDNIVMLTDDPKIKGSYPTLRNILINIYKLVIYSTQHKNTEIWIHYSGHGTYMKGGDGEESFSDENDNRNECIVPVDFVDKGVISDDILNHYLMFLSSTSRCFVVVDACHSGTSLDLQYKLTDPMKSVYEKQNNKVMRSRIVCLSGCRDDQYSLEEVSDGVHGGTLTNTLIQILEDYSYCIRLRDIILEIRNRINEKKINQVPQLTSTDLLDTKLFMFKVITKSIFDR